MKTILSIGALAILMVIGSCSKDDLTSQEQKINMLTSAPWKVEKVTHATDGDLTFQYEAFSIFFTKNEKDGYLGEYYNIFGGSAFPNSFGKWKCNSDISTITFDNGVEMDAVLTKENLTLTFMIAPPSGGRLNGVSGEFTFVLKH